MSLTRILSIFFFLVAIVLAGFLVLRIKHKIDEEARIRQQEDRVIKKLEMIRDAEVAYLERHGRYTGSWDTLINFIDTGKLYLTQRNEKIITLDYGADSVQVTIDTIGIVPVKDSIFVIKEPVNSLVDGSVTDIRVSEGDKVKKGDILYEVETPRGKKVQMTAPEDATVKSVTGTVGKEVDTESSIVLVSYPRISNIKDLPYLPGSKDKKFELFAGTIERGNVVVDVFEAKDTDPVNPDRRRPGNENPLRVGSRTDVTTSGNWE